VYRGVDMRIAGVQAWRSALADSAPFEVPDFRKKSLRKQYRNDHCTPDPARKGAGQPASSIRGRIKLSDEAKKLARKVWKSKGYDISQTSRHPSGHAERKSTPLLLESLSNLLGSPRL